MTPPMCLGVKPKVNLQPKQVVNPVQSVDIKLLIVFFDET